MSLLTNVTAVGVGPSVHVIPVNRTFQGIVSGTGAVSATINVEVSNDGINFILMGTITLSGTGIASDGFASSAKWDYIRGNVTAISGTGATVNLLMGTQ